MPFAFDASSAAERREARHSLPGELPAAQLPLRILVVEDRPVDQESALRSLSGLGYSPELAASAREVLQCLARRSYDLIFTGTRMAEMNGLETTLRIRQLYPTSLVPWIVALTEDLPSEWDAFRRAGIQDFVPKPIQMDDLHNAIGRIPGAWSIPPYLVDIIADDPLAAKEIVTLFLEDASIQIIKLGEQVQTRDEAGARRTFHSIKGSCRQIGALKLSQIIESLEKSLKDRVFSRVSDGIGHMEACFQAIRTEMEESMVSLGCGRIT